MCWTYEMFQIFFLPLRVGGEEEYMGFDPSPHVKELTPRKLPF